MQLGCAGGAVGGALEVHLGCAGGAFGVRWRCICGALEVQCSFSVSIQWHFSVIPV